MLLQGPGIAALDITAWITIIIIYILVLLVLGTIFLKLALGVVESKNKDFSSVFVTNILNVLVGFIPCIGCILQWIIINARHETGILKAILVWLFSILIAIIITVIIIFAIFGLRAFF
jgi:hypothetical protein